MTEVSIIAIAVLSAIAVAAICAAASRIAQLRARSRNITAAGWPPPWLDADGESQCAQKIEVDAYVNYGKRP